MTASQRSLPGEARRAIVAVLAAALLFGTAGTARELGPEEASALSVGAVRIAIGTAVLWLVVLVRRSGATDGAQLRGGGSRRRVLVLLGGAGVAAYTPLFFVAVERVGVALGTVVTIASGPFFTGAIEATVVRRPPSQGLAVRHGHHRPRCGAAGRGRAAGPVMSTRSVSPQRSPRDSATPSTR